MRLKLTAAILCLAAVMTGPFALSPAGAASASTQVAMNCTTSLGMSLSGHFTITMSAPDQVGTATTFTDHFDIAVGEFFGIPAPYPGTISMQFGFSASNATPATFTLTTPTTHFNMGDFVPTVSLDQQLTATGAPGAVIAVQFLSFAYTIAPDSGGTFSVTCQPNAATGVGTIPISLATPQSKADCKKGSWRHLVDSNGMPFRNQGQCVRTTVGAPKD
jgi:hypothetical protein